MIFSDDKYSTKVSTSSDESENNNDDSESSEWVDDYKTILDFEFNLNSSGIKINILESAKDSPIKIFNQIWTDVILDIIISSTNNYGQNLALKNRSHKNSRSATLKNTDKEEINKFLDLCLIFGSVKFLVLRDAFSNNPLYYSIVTKIMSGRRFEQLLNCFSVEYSEKIVVAEGPLKKT